MNKMFSRLKPPTIRLLIILTISSILLIGCEETESRYDSGYNDGYAAGALDCKQSK
jgi:hypothetical protein